MKYEKKELIKAYFEGGNAINITTKTSMKDVLQAIMEIVEETKGEKEESVSFSR